MSLSNAQLMQKGVTLNKSALIKGLFPSNIDFEPEEAKQFFDNMVDQSVIFKNAKVIQMTTTERNLRSAGISSAILYPSENFDITKYLQSINAHKQTLNVRKARGCVPIYDDDLEDGIEGEAFADHVLSMINKKIGEELEFAAYMGIRQTVAGDRDDLWDMIDGWRYQILNATTSGQTYYNSALGAATVLDAQSDFSETTGYIVEFNSTTGRPEIKLHKTLKSLPSRYKRSGKAKLRFYMNDEIIDDHYGELAKVGDPMSTAQYLGTSNNEDSFRHVPMVPAGVLPLTITKDTATNAFASGDTTDVLLTAPDNLVVGILRELTLERDRDVANERTLFFFSIRLDVKVANPHACVLVKNVVSI